MDNLDYIESYFTSEMAPGQAKEFEKRIESDPLFADEVAYYLSVLKVSRENAQSEKKLHFKEIYQKNLAAGLTPGKNISGTAVVRNISDTPPPAVIIRYLTAAAAVVLILFGIYKFFQPVSIHQLASDYANANLTTLSVNMSGHPDSLQKSIRLYNEGKPEEALIQFEKIIQSDTSDYTAEKYAGVSALRLKQYDKALSWFKALEMHPGLFANPGLFFQALTLMERNQPGDKVHAKQILQQVVQTGSEGKETAEEWLKKW